MHRHFCRTLQTALPHTGAGLQPARDERGTMREARSSKPGRRRGIRDATKRTDMRRAYQSQVITRTKTMWIRKGDRDRAAGVDSPIPTQVVSNEEFIPRPQTEKQKQVEKLTMEMGDGSREEAEHVAPRVHGLVARHHDRAARAEQSVRTGVGHRPGRAVRARGRRAEAQPAARRASTSSSTCSRTSRISARSATSARAKPLATWASS